MTAKSLNEPRNFTDLFVQNITNKTEKRVEIRDKKVVGLVLRVTPKAVKTFSLQTRGPDGRPMQITIGRYPVIPLKLARDTALTHLASIKAGKDPRELSRRAKAAAETDRVTLESLLDEVEGIFARTKTMWRGGHRFGRKKVEARAAIENVFAPLLKKPLTKLSVTDFSKAANGYKPKKPKGGKSTANGAASRALAYLRPVFDWASGRGRFRKEGSARNLRLELPDLAIIHDPSIGDPTLEFTRERVLDQDELVALMRLLVYPAPSGLRPKLDARDDYGPIAYRFLLLTLSRVEEVESARVKDFDLRRGTWTKSVKTRRKHGARGPGERRIVTVPLSEDALALLRSLPSVVNGGSDNFVFPSSGGGRLCNWDRAQEFIEAASGTSGWHRHDLRRTAATILTQLGVAPMVIDRLLCHVNPLSGEKISGAAVNYMIDTKILREAVDHERVAVNLLAEAIASISGTNPELAMATAGNAGEAVCITSRMPSPWAVCA